MKNAIDGQLPVFPEMLHRVRQRPEENPLTPKIPKRDNTFSQSRDIREDRAERQIKTTHNSQTFTRNK